MALAEVFDKNIPAAGEPSLSPDVAKIPFRESKLVNKDLIANLFDDFRGCDISHDGTMTNNLSLFKTRERPYGKIFCLLGLAMTNYLS